MPKSKRLIFSIYVEIDDDDLDNRGRYNNVTGEVRTTSKPSFTKSQFKKYKNQIIERHALYAKTCGADYILFREKDFQKWKRSEFREKDISIYDYIGHYRHYEMNRMTEEYKEICYLDFDVIPNTSVNIFENFDMELFNVADSTLKSMWGRNLEPKYFDGCRKDPATKYFHAAAMVKLEDLSPIEHVFNTAIMVAGKDVIKQLNYLSDFAESIELMEKAVKTSCYHENQTRGFAFDNEVLFSHRINKSVVPYNLLDENWHCTVSSPRRLKLAHMIHVMDKRFEKVICEYTV